MVQCGCLCSDCPHNLLTVLPLFVRLPQTNISCIILSSFKVSLIKSSGNKLDFACSLSHVQHCCQFSFYLAVKLIMTLFQKANQLKHMTKESRYVKSCHTVFYLLLHFTSIGLIVLAFFTLARSTTTFVYRSFPLSLGYDTLPPVLQP